MGSRERLSRMKGVSVFSCRSWNALCDLVQQRTNHERVSCDGRGRYVCGRGGEFRLLEKETGKVRE